MCNFLVRVLVNEFFDYLDFWHFLCKTFTRFSVMTRGTVNIVLPLSAPYFQTNQ